MHGSISSLPNNLQSQINGAVMFGDARNQQDKGRIPNFPTSKTRIICAPLDAVCLGTDLVDPSHFSYIVFISTAVNFLTGLL
jgi:cutinase